jgi:hypothetical protein
VATERGQHVTSLDFGLPIVVRLSASTSSAAVTYIRYLLERYRDGLRWSGNAFSIGNLTAYLDPRGSVALRGQWIAAQLIRPSISE